MKNNKIVTKISPTVWFEICIKDMARARKFYETVVGKKLIDVPMDGQADLETVMFPFDDDMNAPNAVVKMQGKEPGDSSMIVYFGCDDCAVEESRVIAAGGKVAKPKFSVGEHGFISLCFDTEDNCFGLHSLK